LVLDPQQSIPANHQFDAPILNIVPSYITKNGKKTMRNIWKTDISLSSYGWQTKASVNHKGFTEIFFMP